MVYIENFMECQISTSSKGYIWKEYEMHRVLAEYRQISNTEVLKRMQNDNYSTIWHSNISIQEYVCCNLRKKLWKMWTYLIRAWSQVYIQIHVYCNEAMSHIKSVHKMKEYILLTCIYTCTTYLSTTPIPNTPLKLVEDISWICHEKDEPTIKYVWRWERENMNDSPRDWELSINVATASPLIELMLLEDIQPWWNTST